MPENTPLDVRAFLRNAAQEHNLSVEEQLDLALSFLEDEDDDVLEDFKCHVITELEGVDFGDEFDDLDDDDDDEDEDDDDEDEFAPQFDELDAEDEDEDERSRAFRIGADEDE